MGHHWANRAIPGESQLTFNYVRSFSDFAVNFSIGRGVNFRSPKETEHIVPYLLQRVWELDNDKEQILWQMFNGGSVSGDCFAKVAYEEAWTSGQDEDGNPIPGVIQQFHPGRVRIIPLNSALCFPEWHPHDRNRMLRFKMKYGFWGVSPEGTRSRFMFTELITDSWIEEYINDQLISSRPNPLGVIPIAHCPNIMVSGSPWGLSDIGDITTLNREYNEKATEVSDIVNYHAAPITIIKGAKSSQLERGPKKVWGGLPKDSDVRNLELGGGGVEAGLKFMALIKKTMHEMTGVPEGALGDVQPISNTTGVALAIQFQSLMQKHNQKKITFGALFRQINNLALLTLAVKEPDALQWNAERDDELQPYQLPFLDINDPKSFITEVHWPPPLPIDKLSVLNEIQLKMGMGIMSKKDAMEELGEVFPDEKMRETFLELVQDAIDQGALHLLNAQISAFIQEETEQLVPGMPGPMDQGGEPGNADGAAPAVASAGGPNVNTAARAPTPEFSALAAQIQNRAYGTTLSAGRPPEPDVDNTAEDK